MRLKHLTLQGYKSFASKIDFLFPTGITAIVGPNGSGKSNIADGIRWVLGEQSMRLLRGKSTADMIFVGGRRRAPAGMAEISLTFDNSDGWLPIEFGEVTVTRRAYRSGENEYLINGARVRLRDIAALFAESGLSERTYTVIGQGLVDAALSLRPQERRALFEDAAGISLYREQREDALQRLEGTQHNLERVYDIISEITPRLQRLEREVERVEEHRRLTAHLERLQRTWYGHHWGCQQATLGHALELAAAQESNLQIQQQEATTLSERLGQLRQQESELRTRLRDWLRQSADLHDKANTVQRELAVAEERMRLLRVQRDELLAELDPLGSQQQAQAERVAQVRAHVERLERERAERRERLAVLERERTALQEQAHEAAQRHAQAEQELRSNRAQLERLNQALFDARAEAARIAGERAAIEERARQLQARREEILAELDPLDSQREAQSGQVDQARAQVEQQEREQAERRERLMALEQEWAARLQQAQTPDQRRTQVDQELRTHRAQLERLNRAFLDARAEAARLAGERDVLDRLQTSGNAYDVGVQALLQAKLEGVLGLLAALIQVPPEWERAIEAALGSDLQAVVVERSAIVREASRVLESAGGRVTLLPLDSLRQAQPMPPGARSAASVVACSEHVRPAVETVLGVVALCDDLATAWTLLPTLPPGSRCVTSAGIVLRADGALLLGAAATGSVLANERARQELPTQLEETGRRCQEIEAQQQAEAAQIATLEVEAEKLARQAVEAREDAAQFEQEMLRQARAEAAAAEEVHHNHQAVLQREQILLERIQAQRVALRQQVIELESEHAAITGRLKEVQDVRLPFGRLRAGSRETPLKDVPGRANKSAPISPLDDADRRCQEIEHQQQAEAEQIAALETELGELARQATAVREQVTQFERERLAPARTEVAVAEETLRGQQAASQREMALAERLQAQIVARRERTEELEAEQAAVAARADGLRAEVAEVEAQLRQARKRSEPAEDELTRLGEEQTTLEEQERRSRDRLRDAEARHSRAQLEVGRCQNEITLLSQRIEEDLGLVELELAESVTAQTPLPLRPLVSQLPVVEELPDGLEEEIQRLKAQLRRLEGVNPNAPADCAETRERHQFLTEQSADLEKASAQLDEVIAELDRLMETSFRETFEKVAARFSETFTTLFNGGAARLELTEPGDLMSTGVDIVAQPPGKRAQRLALLSGGERSLTAVALMFALLQVSPAPFCVLDEVDAMLDEANVGRFRALLQEMSCETQFIVITHNRSTVEAADTIYGVSMGADGMSQVVSLKLD